jgi:lipopolysaccharide/colanic/teichoic acid biosynthesis glycosyltransferase
MRNARQHQLSGRVEEHGAADQIGRFADMAIACASLAVTSPLMLIVALAIKLEGVGPVLDRQSCIGCSGRRFQMLKFRTAMHDPKHATAPWARQTTQIGEFLRYTRIEDLPQLINVLRGEMSMIDRDARSPSFLD